MSKSPNPIVDNSLIQAVVLTDDQGNYLSPAFNASISSLGVMVQGPIAPSLGASMNPVIIGGVDASMAVQFVQMDSNLNVLVSLGTGLDNLDDNATITNSAPYLSQITSTFAGAETTLAQTLSTTGLSGPAIYDAQAAILYVENKSGQTMNSMVLTFTETVGATAKNLCYIAPSVSVANNAVGQIIFPWLGMGGLRQITASMGFAAGVTANGTIKTQPVFYPHPLTDQPLNYTLFGNVASITTASYNQVIPGPGASQRLYLQSYSISNGNGSIVTVVTLNAGSGGTVLDGVTVAPFGGRSVSNLGPNGMGIPVGGSPNLGLFMASLVASACISVYATCRLGT